MALRACSEPVLRAINDCTDYTAALFTGRGQVKYREAYSRLAGLPPPPACNSRLGRNRVISSNGPPTCDEKCNFSTWS